MMFLLVLINCIVNKETADITFYVGVAYLLWHCVYIVSNMVISMVSSEVIWLLNTQREVT